MRFADIPGNTTLKHRLAGTTGNRRVSHAQLFMGNEGSAALPLALAYATYLTCEDPGEDDSCGNCPACHKNNTFVHPDVHYVFPVSSTTTITGKDVVSKSYLKHWRRFISEKPYGNLADWVVCYGGENKQAQISKQESREVIDALSLTSFEGGYKVMMIWLPELMHPYAANALLKILEEPSAGTIFILVSLAGDKLMKTIKSRVQLVQIPPFTDEDIDRFLVDKNLITKEKAGHIARLANGNIRSALQLLIDEDEDHELFFKEWMRKCFKRDFLQLATMSEKYAGMSKTTQKAMITHGLDILRESMVASNEAWDILRVSEAELSFVRDFSKTLTLPRIDQMASAMSETHYYLERNANPKIAFMSLSIRIAKIFKLN